MSIVNFSFHRSEFFADILHSQAAHILNQGNTFGLEPNDILFRQGEPADKCFLVLKGRLKLFKLHEDGKEALLRYIGPGELTAIVSVFKGREYPATAEAIAATEAIGWDEQTMAGLMLKYPLLSLNMLRCTINRLGELQDRYLEICAEQAEQRVARALLRIMKQSGRKEVGGILIDFPLSRQDLADYIGTTLYTVSRTLSTWEKNGWIKSGRERIVVTDLHALVTLTESI